MPEYWNKYWKIGKVEYWNVGILGKDKIEENKKFFR
jgi:hypothetical protein